MASKSEDSCTEENPVDPTPSELFPGYQNLDQLVKEGFKVFGEAIRISNALPNGRDYDFYKNFDSFNKIIENDGNKILHMMNSVMKCGDIESNIKNRMLEEKTELVVEANDVLLERVAINIDEMNGIRKTLPQPVVVQTVTAVVNGSWNKSTNVSSNNPAVIQSSSRIAANTIKLIAAKNILRPQKFFKDKIDNSVKYPWEPRIVNKPNSIKPLAIFLEEFDDRQEYSHPYELELEKFTPTPEQLQEDEPNLPKSLSETLLIEVNKPEQLDDLVETLRGCKEFAVDLEHHSYRSFMGITCLMQISTRDRDYLIDTLSLRDKLEILNEVFTKPTIVKIFHGADKDVEWLQRDLSLYVVNMFDTHQAAKMLEYSGLSLAYLMQRFCNVIPNKQFQLADWRIRPLPDELKHYAREDTHYLIYIYQMLKRELITKGNKTNRLLTTVVDRSTEICKKRYFKPVLNEDSYMDLYRKCRKLLDNRQLHALKHLYLWRDRIAREEDESPSYVLPNHMLLQISETLPREMQGILACCNPIPPLVRSNSLELHQIILSAREQPLIKPILKEDTRARGTTKYISKVNMESPLNCPHDLSKPNEISDNLPTLLGKNIRNDLVTSKIELPSPSYSVFATCKAVRVENLRELSFLSPYERYKLVKPFIQAEEAKVVVEAKPLAIVERTDEDRISSVREHFLKLSKEFHENSEKKKKVDEVESAKSLLEMGGSKKRKREPSVCCDENRKDFDLLQTPVPTLNRNQPPPLLRSNNRKRKFDEVWDEGTPQNQQQSPNKKGKKKYWRDKRDQRKEKREQNQTPNHKQGNNNRQAADDPTDFAPYDYNQVNFQQFRGGGRSVRGAGSMNPNYKSKAWKRAGRGGAGNRGGKAVNFEGKSNSRVRGRGRGNRGGTNR